MTTMTSLVYGEWHENNSQDSDQDPTCGDHPESDNEESNQDSDSATFVFKRHSTRLLAGFRYLRDRRQLFDVTLIAEGQEFPAHRVVLASISDYFLAMFTNGLKESSQQSIHLHGVSAEALAELLRFAYTSEIRITKDNVVAVLASASHVQILNAVDACKNFLSQHITLKNCAEVDKIADMYSLKEVRSRVHCFMCKHWSSFRKTPDFLALSVEQLTCILQSNFPVYCAEVEVLKGLLAWLGHDLAQRDSCMPQVMSLVRYDNLHKTDLEKLPLDFTEILLHVMSEDRDSPFSTCVRQMTVAGRDEVKGVVNTRGYFQTILLVGGFSSHLSLRQPQSNSIRYLDLESQTFKQLTVIPKMKQADFGVEVLDNDVYIVGGSYNEDFTELTHPYGYCFETSTAQWTTIPPMSQERCRFYLGSLNGLLYAVGGDPDNSESLVDCEMYDPESNTWSPISPLPAPRSELAGASFGGKLYVSGGTNEDLDQVQNEMWCYNPEEDLWTACASMLSPRADHTMFTFDDHIYVIGGWCLTDGEHTSVASVDCYSVETNRWETVQHLKTPRRHCSYTLLNGQIYVIGGSLDVGGVVEKVGEVDVLDLTSMEWLLPSMSLPAVWEHSTASVHLPTEVLTS